MSEFEELLIKLNSPDVTEIREKKTEFYKSKINEFNETIISFIKEFVEKGYLTYEIKKHWPIHENDLGDYEVSNLIIKLPGYEISFYPKGTDIIGANGRIDMVCNSNRAMFLLLNKDVNNIAQTSVNGVDKIGENNSLVWKYADKNLSENYKNLNKELFFNIFTKIVNGE